MMLALRRCSRARAEGLGGGLWYRRDHSASCSGLCSRHEVASREPSNHALKRLTGEGVHGLGEGVAWW
eukprot:3376101-Alexandrium_andersonii.AAC.1